MARGPKVRAPGSGGGGSRGGRRGGAGGKRRASGGGGKSLAAAAALSALFGGGGLASGVKGKKGGPGGAGGRGGGGEAEYKPLPSFNKPTAQVKRYSNPTLSNISDQIGMMVRGLVIQEKLLERQSQDLQFGYKEMARATREKNAESGAMAIGGSGALPMDAIKSMAESFSAFDLALKEATALLNDINENGGGAGGPGMPLGVPDKAPKTARKPPHKSYQFVPKAQALDADGAVKKGFEAVTDKNGRVVGYRKKPGFIERQRRQITRDVKALRQAGVKAFRQKIRNPFMKFYRTQKRRLTKAFTRVKDAAMAKLGEWGQAAKNAMGKVGGRAGQVLEKILKDPRVSKVLEAIKKAGGRVNAMTLGRVALYVWALWEPISGIFNTFKNKDKLSDNEFKQQMSQHVADLISEAGVLVATEIVSAFVLATIGSVVPGIGTVIGFILGLIVGGFAYAIISFIYGKTAEEAVEGVIQKLVGLIIEAAYKIRGNKRESASRTTPAQTRPQTRGGAAQNTQKISGSGTVPRGGGAKSNLGVIKNLTVADIINDAAQKAGIDPVALMAIASENAGFDPRKKMENVTGKELFPLTQEQWKQITGKYGSAFPQLKAGINDPRAASIASALLLKDAQDFLATNKLPTTAPALYASWLFGQDGAYKLLTSKPDDVASKLLPEAAGRRPELFKNSAGQDVTSQELVKALYDTTVRTKKEAGGKKSKRAPGETNGGSSSSPSGGGNTSPEGATPAASPAAATPAPAASSSSPGASSTGGETASPAAAAAPAASTGGNASATPTASSPSAVPAAGTPPTPGATTTPGGMAKVELPGDKAPTPGAPSATSPGAVPAGGSSPTPGSEINKAAKAETEGAPAAPVDPKKIKEIEEKGQKEAALNGAPAAAIPTPGVPPAKDMAAKVSAASKEIEKELNTPTSQVNSEPNTEASSRKPAILPSGSAGRAGTGLVLSPYYNPGDISKSIYFSPITYPADAAGSRS